MSMKMKRRAFACVGASCIILSGGMVCEAGSTLAWKSSVTEGAIDDGANWTGQATADAAPGEGDSLVSCAASLPSGTDYTINFPKGATTYAPGIKELRWQLEHPGSVTLNGVGGSFAMDRTASKFYGGVPFSFRWTGSGGVVFDCEDWDTYTRGYSWTNAVLTFTRSQDPAIAGQSGIICDVAFKQGVLDFHDFATTVFARGQIRRHTYDVCGADVTLGTSSQFSSGGIDGMVFQVSKGGTARFTNISWPMGEHSHENAPTNVMRVTGADSAIHIGGTLYVGQAGVKSSNGNIWAYHPTDTTNVFVLSAENGGTLALDGSLNHAAASTIYLTATNGGTISTGSGAFNIGTAENLRGVIDMRDSTLAFGSGAVTIGREHEDSDVTFYATNVTVTAGDSNNSVYLNGANYNFKDSRLTMAGKYIVLHGALEKPATLTFDGGAWTTEHAYVEGYASLILTNGVQAKMADVHLAQNRNPYGRLQVSTGSALQIGIGFYVGTHGTGVVEVCEGGTVTGIGGSNVSFGEYGSGVGILRMTGGSATAGDIAIGKEGQGILEMSGGELSAPRILFGYGTDAATLVTVTNTLRMTGGRIILPTLTPTYGICMLVRKNRIGFAELTGGIVDGRLFGRDSSDPAAGTGYAGLLADGGTIQARAANYGNNMPVAFFDHAELGTKGLTIDTQDYNQVLPQSFENAKDAEGKDVVGKLVKKGNGTLTITTNSSHAVTVLEAGSLAFGDAVTSYSAIEAKNGTTVNLTIPTSGTGISFKGMSFEGHARFSLTGDLETIATNTLFTVAAGGLNEAACAALEAAFVVNGVSGRGYHLAVDMSGTTPVVKLEVTELHAPTGEVVWKGPGDAWNTAANWEGGALPTRDDVAFFRGAEPTTVDVTGVMSVGGVCFDAATGYTLTGTGTLAFPSQNIGLFAVSQGVHAVSVAVTGSDAMYYQVEKDAKLTLSGKTEAGLTKEGDGEVVLSNVENDLLGDITVNGGCLTLPSAGAAGGNSGDGLNATLTEGTLALGAANAEETFAFLPQLVLAASAAPSNPLVVRTESDVTMAVPTVSAGVLVKTGPGKLTLTSTQSKSLGSSNGYGKFGYLGSSDPFTANDGRFRAKGDFGGFNVMEGELELLGAGPTVTTFTITPQMIIGMPCTNQTDSACLRIRDAKVISHTSSSFLELGPRITDDHALSKAALILSNAYLDVTSMGVGFYASKTGFEPRVEAYDSTLHSRWATAMGDANNADTVTSWLFVNSTFETVNNIDLKNAGKGKVRLVMTNSVLTSSATAFTTFEMGGQQRLDATFVQGSDFRVKKFNVDATPLSPHILAFDDSYWTPGTGDFDFAFANPGYVIWQTLGTGLKLNPPADTTWRVRHPVTGTGGFVKEGAGTVTFTKAVSVSGTTVTELSPATPTMAFSGICDIRAGTVNVEAGAMLSGIRFTGSGTLTGTLLNPVLIANEGSPLLSNVTISGKVNVDFGGAGTIGETVTVARYSGTEPDVRYWRAVNAGDATISGVFIAQNGIVTCRLRRNGLRVIIR